MKETFDVIVVGSGISGSWAAKEFCEKGLKVLLLERGRQVEHIKDYPTAMLDPWEFPRANSISSKKKKTNPLISKHYAYSEATSHFYIEDQEQEYIQEKPFDWIRGYQVGGKSLLWARQTQRWSHFEFNNPRQFNTKANWPITYEDLAPWYGHVERFIGISGNKDGIENLPDSEVVGSFEMNAVESHISMAIRNNFPNRFPIIGRTANLAQITETQKQQGRGQCMARSLCERGCPFGGYFSANSSTLPFAKKTGNLTLKTDSIVEKIVYDEELKRATGVQVIDAHTKQKKQYNAKIIFLNASTLNSNLILQNSISDSFPNGLGNSSGILGHYIVFHNYRGKIQAKIAGFEDKYYYGKRPTQVFIPAFENIRSKHPNFEGSYLIAFSANRDDWKRPSSLQVGPIFKDSLTEPGGWRIGMMMQGEVVPIFDNHVRLSREKDKYGLPKLITSVGYTQNDIAMMEDFFKSGQEMLEKSGCTDIKIIDQHLELGRQPGLEVHEMGGARMGDDPASSVLNKYNQLHDCLNVFVTDGACMTSGGNQNPSLTFMALSARAANYATEQFKEGKL
ncbi:FAD-dependent oxidoreductase [Sphingobacterium faecale]|uniref:GMC family oxidoreductase n=1 Tax=Sphingobacterium faecale TaxID=2803775 RepID=A0ABS1R1T5_9SPHI|nr:GMC family oxidoreductase [Sphingobacterium faecale]MBL1408650.1 GMC family oxidoreductase [Sphingobacterium faecale]